MDTRDFVVAPRCIVIYSGPTFPQRAGERCDGVAGHEEFPHYHPLYSRRHFTGEGHAKIAWFTPEQKKRGEVGE